MPSFRSWGRKFAWTCGFALLGMTVFAQSKKPTVMILPSDNWCNQRYFMTSFSNQGTTMKVPNYQQAFMEDTELPQVVSKVGGVLTELGYSLKDAEQEIKSISMRTAEDNVTSSKNAYTNKRIATSTGTTKVSKESIPVLLEQAVKENVEAFDEQMTRWYDDQKKNGREIVLTVRCWDNWENDLETEYDGEELTDCIQDWLAEHTVNGMFNLTDGTESFAQFEQVRIPLANEKGRAMDARAFATELRKYLEEAPFNITSKVMIRGLGEAIVVLGEK